MRFGLWLVPLLFALLPAPSHGQDFRIAAAPGSVTRQMHSLKVHVGGRVAISPLSGPSPAGARRYRHQWPGVYFEAAFTGDRLLLKFEDPDNAYRLTIDDRHPRTLAQPGASDYEVTGLGPGPHRVRLEKVTESVDRSASFDGFYIPAGARALRVRPRARQIEYIGDSGMTGYGIASPSRTCTPEQVRLTGDTQIAYPALVAKRFGADYQVNAISGRGLVRNYGGTAPDDPMSHAYAYAVRDRDLLDHERGWHPQLIFVMLMGNDFYADVKPGERWPTLAALAAEWTEAYARFVIDLHRRTPGARIVIGWPDMTVQTDPEAIRMLGQSRDRISAVTRAAGVARLSFLPMVPGLKPENTACDYHPSAEDHRRIAAYVAGALETLTGWQPLPR